MAKRTRIIVAGVLLTGAALTATDLYAGCLICRESGAEHLIVFGAATAVSHVLLLVGTRRWGLGILTTCCMALAGVVGMVGLQDLHSTSRREWDPLACWVFFSALILIPGLILASFAAAMWAIAEKRPRRKAGPIGVCRTCGHNLTGLTSACCPECGSPFIQMHFGATAAVPPQHTETAE